MKPRLEVHLEQNCYAPGATVTGQIRVAEGGRSDYLWVWLEFHESSQDLDSVVSSVTSGPLHAGDLVAGTTFPFALALPADALPNYRSEHGALYWEVHGRSVKGAFDVDTRRHVTVSLRR